MLYEVITRNFFASRPPSHASRERPFTVIFPDPGASHTLAIEVFLLPVAYVFAIVYPYLAICAECGRITSYNVCYTKLLRRAGRGISDFVRGNVSRRIVGASRGILGKRAEQRGAAFFNRDMEARQG